MLILTRAEAGRRLAAGLEVAVPELPVVLALSATGVQVAGEVARLLRAPLDVVAVGRLEVPGRPHATFGAIANGCPLLDQSLLRQLALPADYLDTLLAEARRAAEYLARAWRAGAPEVPVEDRTVILVDDGLAGPLEVAAALAALHEEGAARLVFAAPSARREVLGRVLEHGAESVLLYGPEAPVAPYLCDAGFSHPTRGDVTAMVRRSREVPTVPPAG